MCLRCWFDFGERVGRLGQVYLTVIQRRPWVMDTLICLICLSTPHLPPHWLTVAQWEAWPLGILDNKFKISAVGLSGVLFPSARVILMIAPWSFIAEERTFKNSILVLNNKIFNVFNKYRKSIVLLYANHEKSKFEINKKCNLQYLQKY